jgi:hypothetical protein
MSNSHSKPEVRIPFRDLIKGDTSPIPDGFQFALPGEKPITINMKKPTDNATAARFARSMEKLFYLDFEGWRDILNKVGYFRARIINDGGDDSHILKVLVGLKNFKAK